MRRCARLVISGLTSAFALLLTARGQAQAVRQAVVWYRASEQCPAGAAFLARLAEKRSQARLAEPADHFDYLVTLVAGNGETIGRLERQTQSGAVAIRELRDGSCERVADALALGLSLALEPGAEQEPPAPVEATPPPEPTAKSAPAAALPAKPEPPPLDRDAPAAPAAAERSAKLRDRRWSLGLAAQTLEGAMPRPLWQGFAFVDFAAARSFALRLGAVGAYGSVSTQVGSVRHWIGAGRAEACPWRFGSPKAGLSPCAVFELGVTGASDSRPSALHARELWAAPGAALRLAFEIAAQFTLEAQAGGLVPLIRETVYAGSEPLYSAEIIAFQASLGISARLW
jgi:hypothetical protein